MIDDQGYDMALRVSDTTDHAGRVRYLASWYNPDVVCQGVKAKIANNKLYRFVYFDQVNDVEVTSASFSMA